MIKKRYFLISILFIFLTISCAYANEDSNQSLSLNDNETFELNEIQPQNIEDNQTDIDQDSILASYEEEDKDYWNDEHEYDVTISAKPLTVYWGSKIMYTIKVTDYWGDPVNEGYIKFKYAGTNYKLPVDDGKAIHCVYANNKISSQQVTITYTGSSYYNSAKVVTTFKTAKAVCTIDTGGTYPYGDNYYTLYVFPKKGYGITGAKIKIQIYTGKKCKTYYKTTSGSGSIIIHKQLSLGSHKVVFKSLNKNVILKTKTSKIVVKKAKASITSSAKGKYYKLKAKDIYGDPIKGLKLKIKIYKGKHYTVKYAKTNSKGIAKFYVGNLKNNIYYKIKFSSANKNYYAKNKNNAGHNENYLILSRGKCLPLWWLP